MISKLFDKEHTDPGVRVRVGALIEIAGCFPNSSVWDNLMMQTINLGLANRVDEIERVLKIVRMEDTARIKFRSCSLGMKQRVGIAMALLGNPTLLVCLFVSEDFKSGYSKNLFTVRAKNPTILYTKRWFALSGARLCLSRSLSEQ